MPCRKIAGPLVPGLRSVGGRGGAAPDPLPVRGARLSEGELVLIFTITRKTRQSAHVRVQHLDYSQRPSRTWDLLSLDFPIKARLDPTLAVRQVAQALIQYFESEELLVPGASVVGQLVLPLDLQPQPQPAHSATE